MKSIIQRVCLLAVLTVLACPAWAQNQNLDNANAAILLKERKALKKIINETIDSGYWRGKLDGTVDMVMRQQLGLGVVKDTWLETKTVGHFEDVRCKRISMHYYITTRKSDIPMTVLKQQLNICRDLEVPVASKEEIARVIRESIDQTELMRATITPYNDEEEKSQYIRLIRQAIRQPGQVFQEPMTDQKLIVGLMSTFGTNGNFSLIMTAVGEVPQQDCARVRIDTVTDHPFTLTGGVAAVGFRQEKNVCAHGNYSEPVAGVPTYLFQGDNLEIITAEEKKTINAAKRAKMQTKPTTKTPAQGKATPTKPPAARTAGAATQGGK
jgi:hypothetical protein